MPTVGVIFEIRQVQTLPGETVRVCGDLEELGCWDPKSAADSAEADVLRLRTGALSYPRWSTSAPVWISYEEGAKGAGRPQAFHLSLASLSTMDSFDDAASVRSLDEESNDSSTSPSDCPDPVDWAAGEASAAKGSTVELEYKFLRDQRQMVGDGAKAFQWEEKIKNRRVSLPQEPGSMWLVSDARWDSDEPPRVTRIDEEGLDARRAELDPDHVQRKPAKAKPAYPVQADCVHPLTPGSLSPRAGASFDIEGEFDALANRKLPELLAERLAAMQSAGEMAAELMELRRESSVAGSRNAQLEEEAGALRGQVARLSGALREVAEGAEEASQQHRAEARGLRRENAELRELNALLAAQLEELGLLMSNTRAELVASRDASRERTAEAARLRAENARLEQECAGLRSEVPQLRSQLSEARAALDAAEEEVAELSFNCEPPAMNRQQSLPLPMLARQFSSPASEPQAAKGGALKAARRHVPKGPGAKPDNRTRAATDMEEMLLQVRSSLSAAPQAAKPRQEEAEEENELKKVLRRRRERAEGGGGCDRTPRGSM